MTRKTPTYLLSNGMQMERPINTNELWQSVLGELELSLSKANFTTWFKNTFIVSLEEKEAIIGVPNMFTKAWLEKKYHDEILKSIRNHTDEAIQSITYTVETRNDPQPTTSEENKEKQDTDPQPQNKDTGTSDREFELYNQTAGTETARVHETSDAPKSLNFKYNFTNFVVGKKNELAHAAAQAVAANPGGVYNPLFIYGGVGLGKTHLLQAIGHEMNKKDVDVKILYVTCEKFTNDFISAVRSGQARQFKNRYRNVDLLLVDDVQFITGKEGTQEEFFHTFNQLHQNNKQIVITSDRPPKAIPALEQRLVSRFECGMMTDIGSPDFETRVAILSMKCNEKEFPLERNILHHIATVVQSNVRELEGALNKIIAFHQFKDVDPTIESVKPILSSFQPSTAKKSITAKEMKKAIASYFDLEMDQLLGRSRKKQYAFPRQILMYLMREEMDASYPSIGSEVGDRDHTTAMHAYKKISNKLEEDDKLEHDLELIKQQLYS